MVNRPLHMNPYEFVVVSALRTQQLLSGCIPRVEGDHNAATLAQMEVAAGCVARAEIDVASDGAAEPAA
jgi:DNA-directed RNA polymerase subunit K/omega